MSEFKRSRLLYFYTAESPFVEKDIEILSSKYEVKKYRFDVYDKKKLVSIFFRQGFFLIKNILGSKAVICQFAGFHSVLPVLITKLFFKKSVIVSGGTDCVSFPSIRYGNFSNKRTALLTRFCFKQASLILPVHESLIYCDYTYQNNDYPHQGIRYFIPGIKTKMTVVYNGYDSNYWKRGGVKKDGLSFLTALGHVNSKFTSTLKGIDLYIELARKFPDASFTILGGSNLEIPNQPKNLELLSNIWGEKLIELFASKQFYVQLSMSEGFPNALSEAMLCECVPIVSSVGGMPDIVGDNGFILKKKDLGELFTLVEHAMKCEKLNELSMLAREGIRKRYSFESRTRNFINAIEELL